MRTRSIFSSLLLAAAAALPAQPQLVVPLTPAPGAAVGQMLAARAPTPAEAAARQFSGPRIVGRRLARAVNEVTRELEWHRSLEEAAAAAEEADKPILWLQILGDLRGRT